MYTIRRMRTWFSSHATGSRVGDHSVNIVIPIRFNIDVKIQIFIRNVAKKTIVRRVRGCYVVPIQLTLVINIKIININVTNKI